MGEMRLGLQLGMWRGAAADPAPTALEAERLGFDSVWTSEAWSSDAVTPLAWVAAHAERIGIGTAVMQIPARSPAATAMTAITLDHLSGGRFRLGLGMSGPVVVEGWHGVAFTRPLARTREYVEIVRAILRHEEPVVHEGAFYRLPAPGGLGLGVPRVAGVRPLRPDLPILLGAMGPRNVALAAEIADGWIPLLFSPDRMDVFGPELEEGFARRAPTACPRERFDIAPMVFAAAGENLDACRDQVRPRIAFYAGGAGTRGRNFYNSMIARYGYEQEAATIQELFLAGRPREAAAAVPDTLVDEIALVGSVARIHDRLDAWRAAGVTLLIAVTEDVATMSALAEAGVP